MTASSVCDRVLLVEGVDDEHVVWHISNRHEHVPKFEIVNKCSFPELARGIVPEFNVSGRLAVGILADANDDPAARWQEIAHRLKEANIILPAQMSHTGTVVGDRPQVGVWLMPDNHSPGELEDFVARMIPGGDPVWPMARQYIQGILPEDRKFSSGKLLRAEIHAWLAARAEPRKMGSAIHTQDLDVNVELVANFVNWLRRIFG